MNENELRAWMTALPTDRTELTALHTELQQRRHVASDDWTAAVGRRDGSAADARTRLNALEDQLRIIEQTLS